MSDYNSYQLPADDEGRTLCEECGVEIAEVFNCMGVFCRPCYHKVLEEADQQHE